jgi:hypothetical protein
VLLNGFRFRGTFAAISNTHLWSSPANVIIAMDPLTALSVAGCIVQFVDFAWKVVSKGNKIYRSNDGSTAENSDLEVVTTDLILLQAKIKRTAPARDDADESTTQDTGLEKLVTASKELAETLLRRLNMAKAQGRYRRWKSLRQALKSVCTKDEIDTMAKRLGAFREELQTHILVSLR